MRTMCCVLAFCMALVAQDALAAKKPKGKDKKNPQEVFAKLDKNSDGSLTSEEFAAGGKAGKKGKKTPQETFSRLDKNSDGKLTLDEFKQTGEKKDGKKRKKAAA